MPVFPSLDGSVLITVEYNDDVAGEPGKVWAILHDNSILGWTDTQPVVPVIIGSLPAAAPATDPILSPLWGQYVGGMVFVPDMWRGPVAAFFTAVASNNGATRKVYANFFTPELASAFQQWARTNPAALSEPPNVTAEKEAMEAEAAKEEAEAKAQAAAEAAEAAKEAAVATEQRRGRRNNEPSREA
jgi:hypothetical protein